MIGYWQLRLSQPLVPWLLRADRVNVGHERLLFGRFEGGAVDG